MCSIQLVMILCRAFRDHLTNIATLVLLKPTAGHNDATVYLHLRPSSGTLPFGLRLLTEKHSKTAKKDCETPSISPVDPRPLRGEVQ